MYKSKHLCVLSLHTRLPNTPYRYNIYICSFFFFAFFVQHNINDKKERDGMKTPVASITV